MDTVIKDIIKTTKIEFLKNDLELKKMVICERSFERLRTALADVIHYSAEKLPDNQIRYLGVLIEKE